mgnify:CR=1 FL=1
MFDRFSSYIIDKPPFLPTKIGDSYEMFQSIPGNPVTIIDGRAEEFDQFDESIEELCRDAEVYVYEKDGDGDLSTYFAEIDFGDEVFKLEKKFKDFNSLIKQNIGDYDRPEDFVKKLSLRSGEVSDLEEHLYDRNYFVNGQEASRAEVGELTQDGLDRKWRGRVIRNENPVVELHNTAVREDKSHRIRLTGYTDLEWQQAINLLDPVSRVNSNKTEERSPVMI